MKIQRVTVEVLETPLSSQYSAGGSPVDSNWHILARIYTEDGIQGIGFNVALRPTLVKAAAQACQELGDLLVGMEVMEIEAARSRMERAAGWAGPGGMVCIAMAPLDIALWDAAGKIANQPLYRMLGGYRDRVRTYASDTLWYSLSLDGLAQSAKAHASAGFNMLKLRLGHEANPQAEVDRVHAVRQAVGAGVEIMVDATESWNESQAMASGRALQEAGIVWLEDPVNHQNIAGLAHLSQALDVPIAAGERLFGVEPFVRTLEARAVNIAIIDLARVGASRPG